MKSVAGVLLAGVVLMAGCSGGSDAAESSGPETSGPESSGPETSDESDLRMVDPSDSSDPPATVVEVTDPAETMPVMTAAPTPPPVVYDITPEMKDWQAANASNLISFGEAMLDVGAAGDVGDMTVFGAALDACADPAAAMAESAAGVLPADVVDAMGSAASLCPKLADAAVAGGVDGAMAEEFAAALGVFEEFLGQLTAAP